MWVHYAVYRKRLKGLWEKKIRTGKSNVRIERKGIFRVTQEISKWQASMLARWNKLANRRYWEYKTNQKASKSEFRFQVLPETDWAFYKKKLVWYRAKNCQNSRADSKKLRKK